MGNQQIRTPQQQRSIEKRSKIIEAGYQLFCEKGYHHTNTAEIAKLAGVSTGIVYSYFKDKKDIFMYVIEAYENSVAAPVYEIMKSIDKPIDLAKVIRQMIVKLTESHTLVKSVHEEMQALAHTDKEIGELFYKFQSSMAANLVDLMNQFDIHPTNAYEKAHLIIDIIENLSHEMMYQQHEYLNYEVMTDVAVNAIVDMLMN
ncbi:MAG TPA: TetR/AcrR family transcriptional regulator [Mobilitalea sp.]|nr:TetR/AcrR family transcriptional regulator [Mobilitalea sp.]